MNQERLEKHLLEKVHSAPLRMSSVVPSGLTGIR